MTTWFMVVSRTKPVHKPINPVPVWPVGNSHERCPLVCGNISLQKPPSACPDARFLLVTPRWRLNFQISVSTCQIRSAALGVQFSDISCWSNLQHFTGHEDRRQRYKVKDRFNMWTYAYRGTLDVNSHLYRIASGDYWGIPFALNGVFIVAAIVMLRIPPVEPSADGNSEPTENKRFFFRLNRNYENLPSSDSLKQYWFTTLCSSVAPRMRIYLTQCPGLAVASLV